MPHREFFALKIILDHLQPSIGSVHRNTFTHVYLDQDYSLINTKYTVYEQAQQYNTQRLEEHEVKIRLDRFLFPKNVWDKSCKVLSGGEKMRLALCCLNMRQKAPDLIVLDEPTNNLDLANISILTNAIKNYTGTLIVISHDSWFRDEVLLSKEINLEVND